MGGSTGAEAESDDGIDDNFETDPEELLLLPLLDASSADAAECSDDVDALASVDETELCSESQRVPRIESIDAEPS